MVSAGAEGEADILQSFEGAEAVGGGMSSGLLKASYSGFPGPFV